MRRNRGIKKRIHCSLANRLYLRSHFATYRAGIFAALLRKKIEKE